MKIPEEAICPFCGKEGDVYTNEYDAKKFKGKTIPTFECSRCDVDMPYFIVKLLLSNKGKTRRKSIDFDSLVIEVGKIRHDT
jgi:uncharacterized protein YlaI